MFTPVEGSREMGEVSRSAWVCRRCGGVSSVGEDTTEGR